MLEPYKAKIHALLGQDHELSGVRILEIIRGDGYAGQVSILRDYLRQVRPEYKPRAVYLRMSYEPGEYGQVDWGEMPKPVLWQGQWCKVYALVMVLCYSRLMYVEFSLSSQLSDFLRCHQNGLRFFGGSPKAWVYDNLTSVVKRRRGQEVSFNETFAQFAGYYLLRPHPCWPAAPNQKGVVERPIDYIKGNFWAGRYFADFPDLVQQGWHWLQETANARVHRTTQQVPQQLFETERSHLLGLPIMAVGNDLSYEEIFVQHLMHYGRPGDLVIAISGSGNSPNVLKAVGWANRHGLTTFGLTGFDGGQLKQCQTDGLHVELHDMGMVESIHLCLFHWVLNDVFARINHEGRYAA